MTGAMPIEGLSYMVCQVISVEGNLALVRDQQGRQHQVRRDFQRAKGPWPGIGEQWIIDKGYGNQWTFALLISPSQTAPALPVISVANLEARNALVSPARGQMTMRLDTFDLDYYDGNTWRGTKIRTTSTGTIANADVDTFTTPFKHATMTIVDPGWPYRLRFYGQFRMKLGSNTAVDVLLRDGDGTGGTILNPIYSVDGRNPGNQTGADPLQYNMYPIAFRNTGLALTGGRVVSFCVQRWNGGGGDGWKVGSDVFTKIFVDIVPI